ncbi:MAG: hypothetical protein IKL39_00015, partial [Mailhella sp.]|nr:hypothetical protein [Mailhella sp.]
MKQPFLEVEGYWDLRRYSSSGAKTGKVLIKIKMLREYVKAVQECTAVSCPHIRFPSCSRKFFALSFLGAPGGEVFSVPALSKQSAGRTFSDGIHQWKKYM